MYNPEGNNMVQPTLGEPNCWAVLIPLMSTRSKSVSYRRTHPIARETYADVVCYSGCRDDQLSFDVCDSTGCYGAMSRLWMQCLKKDTSQSYAKLLGNVRQELLHNGFRQTPCLSTNHEMDMNVEFSL